MKNGNVYGLKSHKNCFAPGRHPMSSLWGWLVVEEHLCFACRAAKQKNYHLKSWRATTSQQIDNPEIDGPVWPIRIN